MKMNKHNKHDQSSKAQLIPLVLEKAIFCIMVLVFLFAFSSQVFASSQQLNSNEAISTTSIGGLKGSKANSSDRLNVLKQQVANQEVLIDNNEQYSLATLITRDQKIAQKQLSSKQLSVIQSSSEELNGETSISARTGLHDLAIFNASSTLLEDDDLDGYYNTFGIQFDADILNTDPLYRTDVYAEIYLSENGGPWIHLYTTDFFELQGDTADDEYEIITHLSQNYRPNQYNVLIDLYQAGYNHIAASYSSDDTNSLYALPLESQDWETHEEVYYEEHHHGGSVGLFGILLIFILGSYRLVKHNK